MKRKKLKIELAKQDKINELDYWVQVVLKALGHSEALVTDESMVGDFLDIFDKKESKKELKKAIKKLKIDMDSHDYIYEVAKKLKGVKK